LPPPPLNRIKPELDIIWRDEWDYACIANGQAPQHRNSGIQWYSVYGSSGITSAYSTTLCVCVKTLEPFSFLYFYFHSDTHILYYIAFSVHYADIFPFAQNFYFNPPTTKRRTRNISEPAYYRTILAFLCGHYDTCAYDVMAL